MNAIHGQDSWQAQHVPEHYADHSAWDVSAIIQILQRFFAASGGTSLPDLAEYNWRLDKVTVYKEHGASEGLDILLWGLHTCIVP